MSSVFPLCHADTSTAELGAGSCSTSLRHTHFRASLMSDGPPSDEPRVDALPWLVQAQNPA